MHELLLLSSQPVPPASCHLILSVLAGFAAAQPTPYSALHLIFAPVRAPYSAGSATRSSLPSQIAAQQKIAGVSGDLFYVQLVGRLHEKTRRGRGSEGGAAGEDVDMDGQEQGRAQNATAQKADSVVDLDAHPWTLEFRDLPEPGKARPVASRLMATIPFTGGDPVGFVRGMGYEYVGAVLPQSLNVGVHQGAITNYGQGFSPPTSSTASSSSTALSKFCSYRFCPYRPRLAVPPRPAGGLVQRFPHLSPTRPPWSRSTHPAPSSYKPACVLQMTTSRSC